MDLEWIQGVLVGLEAIASRLEAFASGLEVIPNDSY